MFDYTTCKLGDVLFWDGVYWIVCGHYGPGKMCDKFLLDKRLKCTWWDFSKQRWTGVIGLIDHDNARKVGKLEALVVLGIKI